MFGRVVKKAASSWRRNNTTNQVISIDSSSEDDEQPANKRRKVTVTSRGGVIAASTPTKKKKKRVVVDESDSETEGDAGWSPSKLLETSKPRKRLARKPTARKRKRFSDHDKKKKAITTTKKQAASTMSPATSTSMSPALKTSPQKSTRKRRDYTLLSDSESSPEDLSAPNSKQQARRPLHQEYQRSVSPINGDDASSRHPSRPPTRYRSARAERLSRIKSEDKTVGEPARALTERDKIDHREESCMATNDDEDDDFDPDGDPHTTSKFESHCWRCEWRIKQDDGDDGPCLYQLHVHPLLRVPTCSLCCELAASIDIPSDQNKATACCACNGNNGSLLLLCDTCPRVFCERCVEQAWGDDRGAAHVKRITRDPDMSWACLVCSPPEALQRLQIKDSSAVSNNESSEEMAEQVIERLTAVEEELEHFEEVLTEDHFQRVRREKERELNDATAVEKEMSEWKEDHLKHYDLVQDTKVDLLERLDAFGICADKFYKYQKKKTAPHDDDSAWKRLADKVLDERDLERRPIRDSGSSDDDESDQEQEALAHVEDLCTSSQLEDWETEEIVENRSRWNQHGHSREWLDRKLSKHLKRDDELLKQAGTLLIKVGTVSDEKETQREVAEASYRSSSGVTIRRDEIQTLVARKKKPKTANGAASTQRKGSAPLEARHEASVLPSPSASPSKANGRHLSENGTPSMSPSKTANGRRFFKIENGVAEHPNSWDSCFELASAKDGARAVRVISHLASQLKPHQVDGVRFLWENSCKDLETVTTQAEAREERGVGGCICAHMMGLGKSLQVVTLVHTLLNNPNLRPQRGDDSKPFVGKILLIVPVNTIANWNNEFDKWTKDTNRTVPVYDVSTLLKEARSQSVLTWSRRGGVLLVGSDMYTRLIKNDQKLAKALQAGPEMVIIDEAHTLLKSETSQISKTLGPIATKRRIILSGTPFVNNLKEYHKLSDWVRPGVFGLLSQFERSFANPIMAGLASDASLEQVALQVKKTKLLYKTLEPFMQRRDIGILKRDLPPSQTVVLYIRPSKLQARLYTAFKRFKKRLEKDGEDLPFLTEYQMLRPLHNHPYCLVSNAQRRNGSLVQPGKRPSAKAQGEMDSLKTASSNTAAAVDLVDSDAEATPTVVGVESENGILKPDTKSIPAEVAPKTTTSGRGRKSMDYSWIEKIVPTTDNLSKVAKVEYGNKLFLLLQILAHAQSVGDKVVVFSQCLRTLDFIETVLKGDWAPYCSGYEDSIHLGHWKKGSDYLRIDGSTQSSERGDLVSTFHENAEESKLFLLSIEAGGIGINLVAANRVVLFDNHWNPTISSQAFHRCYRYGQQKPVYGYRLITDGTMEEKIFSRSMNKTGIAARVVDQKYPERNFTARELAEIKEMDTWVQCEACEKWRMLFLESEDDLPHKWYCKMNSDPKHNTCIPPQRTKEWYDINRPRILNMITQHLEDNDRESMDVECSERTADAAKEECVRKDQVLVKMGLLNLFKDNKGEEKKGGGIKQRKRNPASVLSKIEFMEMLQSDSSDLSIEASHREAEAANQAKEAAAKVVRATEAGVSIDEGGLLHPAAAAAASIVETPRDQTRAHGTQKITSDGGAVWQGCDHSEKRNASLGGKECPSLHQARWTKDAAAKQSIVKTEVAPPPILQSQPNHTGKSQVEAIELIDSDDE